jgi:hypothetical protein
LGPGPAVVAGRMRCVEGEMRTRTAGVLSSKLGARVRAAKATTRNKSTDITRLEFERPKVDTCLYVYRNSNGKWAMIAVSVDDLLITGIDTSRDSGTRLKNCVSTWTKRLVVKERMMS